MKFSYLQSMVRIPEFCESFKKEARDRFFSYKDSFGKAAYYPSAPNTWFCFTPNYRGYHDRLRQVVEICDALGISKLEELKESLVQSVNRLGTAEYVKEWRAFEFEVNNLKEIFGTVTEEIKKIVESLSDEEVERMNEAMHCIFEGCYYSSTAMSASAIEYRLLQLMKQKTPEERLDELTLGELIFKGLNDKQYADMIPKKHKALLELCNTYRIYSVHAKREKITKGIALSVLNLTFLFLLDRSLATAKSN